MNAPVKPSVRLEAARQRVRAHKTSHGTFYRRGSTVFQYGSNLLIARCEDHVWAARVVACLNLQIANGALASGIVPERVRPDG